MVTEPGDEDGSSLSYYRVGGLYTWKSVMGSGGGSSDVEEPEVEDVDA